MGRHSSTICEASSRVGARTRHAGRRSSAAIRSERGTANASVLPDPVGDLASTSRPASTSPITRFWIANGSMKPRLDSALTTAFETPSWANDFVDIGKTPDSGDGPRTIREAMADPNRFPCGTQASCLAAGAVAGRTTEGSGRRSNLPPMHETDRAPVPRGELLKQISNAMVGIKKNLYGKGPT